MQFPSSLRGGVHGLEDAIITLSGPGIALSGIIAGVDLLTGGHAMQSIPWLTVSWAVCLLLSLDFQVLALGARAHRVYLSQKGSGRKAAEILLAFAIAAAISYVSIQMQSIVAKMSASGLSIDQATTALGIDANALIFERSVLVLVLIFLSGWFRHEVEPVNQGMLNQGIQWSQLEEWFSMVVQMNQGMLNQVNQELMAQLATVVQSSQGMLNQVNQAIGDQLAMVVQSSQDQVSQLDQRLTSAIEQVHMNQQPGALALAPDQFTRLLNELSQGQQRQMEAVFSRFTEQVLIREERPARQFSQPRLRALPAASSPIQPSALADQEGSSSALADQEGSSSALADQQPGQPSDLASLLTQPGSAGGSEGGARVLNYLDQCKAASSEPSLSQIEQACQVSHNTAINWRRQWREKSGLLITSGK